VDNAVFTKNEEILRAKHCDGGPLKEGSEASISLASPKSTTEHIGLLRDTCVQSMLAFNHRAKKRRMAFALLFILFAKNLFRHF